MAGSSHFKVPHTSTDTSDFLPVTKLPEHLAHYERSAEKLREKMTPALKLILGLTDKTALRSAALPQSK